MAKCPANTRCEVCGGLLVPPQITSGFEVPKRAKYLCLGCGRAFQWIRDPPRLVVMQARAGDDRANADGPIGSAAVIWLLIIGAVLYVVWRLRCPRCGTLAVRKSIGRGPSRCRACAGWRDVSWLT